MLGFQKSQGSSTNTSNMKQIKETRQGSVQHGQSGGVLKLNVAIAGEFSMGNFGNNHHP